MPLADADPFAAADSIAAADAIADILDNAFSDTAIQQYHEEDTHSIAGAMADTRAATARKHLPSEIQVQSQAPLHIPLQVQS